MQQKILLIEDDSDMAKLISSCLEEGNFTVEVASDGRAGLTRALETSFDVVIADLTLPKLGGIEICRELRNAKKNQAIIIVTSRNDETDKVLGLELGADDYVTKPFAARELVARVRAVLRRSSSQSQDVSEILQFDELSIDQTRHIVTLHGNELQLTSTEYDLLVFLASNPGRPFTRDELMEQIWGYQTSTFDGTITTHLSRLRSKIEPNPAQPKFIQTVRGVGYKFKERS